MSSSGRVTVITGAGGGIGGTIAEQLAGEGVSVVCADLEEEAAEQSAEAVRRHGFRASAVALDVTDEESCRRVMTDAADRFDGIDLLVNAAGVGAMSRTDELSLDDWARTLQVNLTGTFLMCREAIPHLLPRHGAIVNIASVSGLRAAPYNAAYAASKAGVISLTKTIAAEYAAHRLRANCVAPGGVATGFLAGFVPPEGADAALIARSGRLVEGPVTPAEVAAAVCYLASPKATHTTGTALVIDGASSA